MKHPSTRALYDYWNARRGTRAAPERLDIDPADIRTILGDTFMLAADFADDLRLRLAGTRVCALFCREIKGEAFTALWSDSSRAAVEELAAVVVAESAAAVAGVSAPTGDGAAADLEMLLLPIAHGGQTRIRALGALAPIERPYWLGERPVTALELVTFRHLDQGAHMPPGEAVNPHRPSKRPDFVVYDGGRHSPPGSRTGLTRDFRKFPNRCR